MNRKKSSEGKAQAMSSLIKLSVINSKHSLQPKKVSHCLKPETNSFSRPLGREGRDNVVLNSIPNILLRSYGPFLEEPTFQGQRQAPNAITEQHSEVRANKGEQIVFLET